MPLYVVPVARPAPGADWQTVVPGQYLWNVTGITATLDTSTPGITIAADASGNGNDGTYMTTSGDVRFVDGLVPGDAAMVSDAGPPSTVSNWVEIPVGLAASDADFTIAFWCEFGANFNGAGSLFIVSEGADPNARVIVGGEVQLGQPGSQPIQLAIGFGNWIAPPGPPMADGIASFIVITYSAGVPVLYRNGALVGWAAAAPFGPAGGPNDTTTISSATGNAGIVDEVAFFDYALSAGDVAALYAAGSAFSAYSAAVAALTPRAYYHLDDGAIGPGRQVDLIVTDGTHTVLEIPTGFGVPDPASSFDYSWQPTLRSSTQTGAGRQIAIAIPRLVLPAGYTIGTRTLDLDAADQWRDVTVWWDSNVQDAHQPIEPYAYPPGALLVYHRKDA